MKVPMSMKQIIPLAIVIIIVGAILGTLIWREILVQKKVSSRTQLVTQYEKDEQDNLLMTRNVTMNMSPSSPNVDATTTFEFHLVNPDGHPFILVPMHARLMHVVIIGSDMDTILHVHPEDFAAVTPNQGMYRVNANFSKGGVYAVLIDFMTVEGSFHKYFTLHVNGNQSMSLSSDIPNSSPAYLGVKQQGDDRVLDFVSVSKNESSDANALTIKLSDLSHVKAGSAVTLDYYFMQRGIPVTDLAPYLDAPMHVIVAKEDLSTFLHVHGVAGSNIEDEHYEGESMNHTHMDMSEHVTPAAFGPHVRSEAFMFPSPGKYHAFVQVKHHGMIYWGENSVVVGPGS